MLALSLVPLLFALTPSSHRLTDYSGAELRLVPPSMSLSSGTRRALELRVAGRLRLRVATAAAAVAGRDDAGTLNASGRSVLIRLDHSAVGGCTRSYVLRELGHAVEITATGESGVLNGIGRLLRELRSFKNGSVYIPSGLRVGHSGADELWPMRGHQISTAHYPSSFKTWAELGQYANDLANFGTTQLELAHVVTMPATTSNPGVLLPVAALTNFSSVVSRLGLNVSFWWPTSLCGADNAAAALAAIPSFGAALFEGGLSLSLDAANWSDDRQCATLIRKAHPMAKIYVAAAAHSTAELDRFFAGLAAQRSWVSGVATHMAPIPLSAYVARVPPGFPIRM